MSFGSYTPPMPGWMPCFAHAVITGGKRLRRARPRTCGNVKARAQVVGSDQEHVDAGNAAIASAFSMACGVSSMDDDERLGVSRPASIHRSESGHTQTAAERPSRTVPDGRVFAVRHGASRSSTLSTCGTTIPAAGIEDTRRVVCSFPGTRTIGRYADGQDAMAICAAVSRSIELCSMSMNSQS